MATVVQSQRNEEFLLSEANGALSREAVTIAAGQDLQPGAVLGKVTATGEYKLLDPAATDGSQTAAAVLLYRVQTDAASTAKAAVIARLAEVDAALLQWPAGITTAQKDTALGQLAGNYIIAR